MMKVPFGDLLREYNGLSNEIDGSIERVLKSGWFILGKEVENFEKNFAKFIGTKYSVSCANGTDAITLSLRALNIKDGDEVITQTNTCIPTVCGIVNANATPVFCDVNDDNLMININDIIKKITDRTKAIIPVNLFGASADYDKIMEISERYSIPVIEDCAQSHGSKFGDQKTGTFGKTGCFSFYPSKNLGCYGDGGAVTTNHDEIYHKLLMLRNYGQEKRYFHSELGINSRLDEMQAAILNTKLTHLDGWNKIRQNIASRYDKAFEKDENVTVVRPGDKVKSVYHLYIVKVRSRERLQEYLTAHGISTLIHYPVPSHLQKAYDYLGYKEGDFEISEKNSKLILSLPVFPQMEETEVDHVIKNIRDFYEGAGGS
ncbi:MAG: DegT/DnrJ/EryC1/StrS family aminotransferase [bacterium]